MCLCAYRVQHRCDEQVFAPEELTVHIPGFAVRVEPAGRRRNCVCYFVLCSRKINAAQISFRQSAWREPQRVLWDYKQHAKEDGTIWEDLALKL